MFVSDKFVFLELHKTGCTHILKILNSLLGGEIIGKHNQASPDVFGENKIFLGSIRDPWEWYTSLWAYGCDKRGAIFWQVTRRKKSLMGLGWKSNPYAAFLSSLAVISHNPKEWLDTYRNANDAEAFRTWLHMMHDAKYLPHIGGTYSHCAISQVAGLMTFRYLKLFCTKLGEQKNLENISSFDQVVNYKISNCFIDYFIRNENLESDLLRGLEKNGVKIPRKVELEILSRSKTNVSSRKHGVQYYYDGKVESIISSRERLIIEKFGYVAPSLRTMK